jgi:hypothetical protein
MRRIDRKTGLPYGDHGTANEAIDYLLSPEGAQAPGEETIFLRCWREGADADEWPDYYAWLRALRTAYPVPLEVNWRLVAAILAGLVVWRELLSLAAWLLGGRWP